MSTQIPQNKIHAVDRVIHFFRKYAANYNNTLACDGTEFLTKMSGKWEKVSEEQARKIVLDHLEEWYGEDWGLEEEEQLGIARCPKCNDVNILDALSRDDNKTMICSDCGTREALAIFSKFDF